MSNKNQDSNELFDGGEQFHDTDRSSSYSTGDLLYRIFCWYCGSSSRKSKEEKSIRLQNEFNAFNQERDIVHMVANAKILENKLEQLEQRVAENEMSSQNLPAHNFGSVPSKKKRKEIF